MGKVGKPKQWESEKNKFNTEWNMVTTFLRQWSGWEKVKIMPSEITISVVMDLKEEG